MRHVPARIPAARRQMHKNETKMSAMPRRPRIHVRLLVVVGAEVAPPCSLHSAEYWVGAIATHDMWQIAVPE